MTQAVIKMPCTDGACKHQHEMLVDLEELGVKAETQIPPKATVTKLPEIEKHEHQHEIPKEDPHKLLAENLPKGINFARCSGEDCGHKKVKNLKGLVTKFKTCTNCKANTVPKSKKYCPTCGKDESEDEPFEDSDVELEVEEEDGD